MFTEIWSRDQLMQKAYFKSALVSHSHIAFEKTCTLISRVRLSVFQQEVLAESRRSSLDKSGKDLSRNIEGDSVRRVPITWYKIL